ncbi:MAG: DUF2063 domain-containing protein [Gammaproteobacteria bacterium]
MQSAMAAALLNEADVRPPGLRDVHGAAPTRRFGVYRNNVLASLIDALADTYPVVQALVGETFFRAMAARFVRAAPPRSPVLAWYGAELPGFIAQFAPAAALPYLADVARLEWLRVDAWHAADATPLTAPELAAGLSDEAQLAGRRFALHPALRVMTSAHPAVSLWAAHQSDDPAAALSRIDMTRAEAALIVRPQLQVRIVPIAPDAAGFIDALQSGRTLGAAAADAQCDVTAALGVLIGASAFTHILHHESPS